jgi:hypothetical protein
VISNRLLRSLPEPADLAQTLQRSNPGLRLSGNTQNIDVNGLPGRSVVLTGASPIQHGGESLRERDWLVTVPRRAVYLSGLHRADRDFSELRSTYERMLGSLQVQ